MFAKIFRTPLFLCIMFDQQADNLFFIYIERVKTFVILHKNWSV